MEFLRKQAVPFQEVDVSRDVRAGQEIMRRTGQMGVPVITDAQEAIVGFDLPRLQRMAARHRKAPGLGLKVADAKDGPGAYVGGVREGSPAARAGLQVGDVIVELSGLPISSVDELEHVSGRRPTNQPTSLTIRRNGLHQTIILR